MRVRALFCIPLLKLQLAVVLLALSVSGHSETLQLLQEQLKGFPHAVSIARSNKDVRGYEIGLGAMEKVGGQWKFKDSDRSSGVLHRQTWQLIDGFTSLEVMEELIATLEADEQQQLLFSCDGRRCGQAVQWANRVFKERILYGREEMQRYRVYSLGTPAQYRVLLFSAARTADRQYLHMEVLELAP